MNNGRPLTTGDVARYCHVTPQAVLKWIKAGKLQAYSTPGGQHRVEQRTFVEFLHEYEMPVPAEFQNFNNQPSGTVRQRVATGRS